MGSKMTDRSLYNDITYMVYSNWKFPIQRAINHVYQAEQQDH